MEKYQSGFGEKVNISNATFYGTPLKLLFKKIWTEY